MLAVEGVAKHIGSNRVLRDVTFDVAPGQCLVVYGRNGAGKTTLMRILAGASRPTRGRITLNSSELRRSHPQLRAIIGYLAHDPFLHPDLTGEENLIFHARTYGAGNSLSRVPAVLHHWGLAAAAARHARFYSRGMKQRLGLAMAFFTAPQLVLLDEPLTGLDAEARELLGAELAAHLQRGGAAVITTHDQLDFLPLQARISHLEDGSLVLQR